jgi:hypothetical protein
VVGRGSNGQVKRLARLGRSRRKVVTRQGVEGGGVEGERTNHVQFLLGSVPQLCNDLLTRAGYALVHFQVVCPGFAVLVKI